MRTLRALAVSDQESAYIWDYFDPRPFAGVDVIISCGDLKPSYLSFLVTMVNKPLFYVHGNHDARYAATPPEGCTNIGGRILEYKGIRFMGLDGCKSGCDAPYHLTEAQMERSIRRTLPRFRRAPSIDVLVTHAPAMGLGDGEDGFHEGFACFRSLLDRFAPAYHLHGHQHMAYGANVQRTLQYGVTTVVNCDNYYIFDMTFPDGKE
ncbi:MAG: metallophosphoesterase [Clostridia bacterium]|nr:metallophosphoesterase [Clostridia bacterium]